MTRWQRPARLAAGVLGIAGAVLVYLGLGERPQPVPPPPVERIDPHAVAESIQGVMEGVDEGFELRFATMASYDDGSTRLTGVQITTSDRDGRSFVVSAGEAHETSGTRDTRQWDLRHDVRLRASDGFELATDRGSFDEAARIVRASGPVTFGKGRMTGRGRGMVYDLNTDVLRVASSAEILFAGEEGTAPTRVTGGAAVLDRMGDTLLLERDVLVLDAEQVMRADRALAHLSAEGGHVTAVELRGRAQVDGASAIETMRARAIDLEYTDDGQVLERATLAGDASVALDGAVARQFGGQHLDVTFAPDGSLERVTGRDGVRMDLPASADAPARRVESVTFHAAGRDGSVGDIQFDGEVVFREETADGTTRVARARALALDQDPEGVLRRAVFAGDATFEDAAFGARAAEAVYEPARGVLLLSGMDARGEPRVEDERVIVDARTMAIGLESRRIDADGRVKTTLLPPREDAPARRPARRPGLLAAEEVASVTSDSLVYEGAAGRARYTGGARLWQKETDLRADTLDIDLETGDLTARGLARAVLAFESGRSQGEADEIVYADGARRVTYRTLEQAEGTPRAPARVTGPQGDLRATTIALFLAEADSRVMRLEAEGSVDALVDERRITGAHLAYEAPGDRYVMSGSAAVPVRVRMADPCREMLGRTLIYSRAADTMQVDGREVSRTETTRRGSCR